MDRLLIATAGCVPIPQQGRHAFEAAGGDQFLDGVAAHHQPASLPIDLAHDRVSDDHAVEAAVHPRLQHLKSLHWFARGGFEPNIYIVNID